MRLTALIWFCTCVLAPLLAQPLPLLPRTHAYYTPAEMDVLEAAWRSETARQPENEEAWLQLFLVTHRRSWRLQELRAEMERALGPDNYAVYYADYLLERNSFRWVHYQKARALQPERVDWLIDDAIYHELNGETEARKATVRRLNEALPFPEELLEYNYNQLQSVDVKGYLLTDSELDTHASWLLQEQYGIRPDISLVLFRSVNSHPAYRRRVLDRAGVGAYDDTKHHPQRLIDALLGEVPVYFSISRGLDKITYKKNRVFLTGLAARYDRPGYRNTLPLVQSFRDKWRMKELRTPRSENRVTQLLDRNYLPALLELNEVGGKYGFDRQLVRELIDTIALRNDIVRRVNRFLDEPERELYSGTVEKSLKVFEQAFVEVPTGRFHPDNRREGIVMPAFSIQTAEVSVADYREFLDDLRRGPYAALADSLAPVAFDWQALLGGSVAAPGRPELTLPSDQTPILNIPRRGAELYARWLGEAYAAAVKTKDGSTVRFRLPTKQEFAYAATGGREFSPYPWGGPYYRNDKGCALANWNTYLEKSQAARKETGECPDGTPFTTLVSSFYPNNFGLYNMSGNAAEMLAEEGLVTGGSWLDAPEDGRIGLTKEQPLPHPSTGFRLVMETIE